MTDENQTELDGMPDHSPIIRVNGDTLLEALPKGLKLDDEFKVQALGTVKRIGQEHVGGKRRRFVQIHLQDIKLS